MLLIKVIKYIPTFIYSLKKNLALKVVDQLISTIWGLLLFNQYDNKCCL